MKTILLLLVVGTLSCNNVNKTAEKTIASKPIQLGEPRQNENSKYHTKSDTVNIVTEIGDTLVYCKSDFNQIIDNHPEFLNDFPTDPDEAYHCGNEGQFSSEAGRDNYCILYAYFLKQRNGVEKYAGQRRRLIGIYSNINSLFGNLQYGGTYFGHQTVRIMGYAEYSIYLLPKTKEDIEKNYDIKKQKSLYIESLRQLIEDENKIDFNTVGEQKHARSRELNKIVDELDNLISDNFYLRRAQEFQYRHYEYY